MMTFKHCKAYFNTVENTGSTPSAVKGNRNLIINFKKRVQKFKNCLFDVNIFKVQLLILIYNNLSW
jgi:hypothetical protein